MSDKALREIVDELGEFERGEHRKYSEFFADCTLEVTPEVLDQVDALDSAWANLLAPFMGMRLVTQGMWSDDNGYDSYDLDVYTRHERLIPEHTIVVPATIQVRWERVKPEPKAVPHE
jgi:hypothetical protein